jgi:acetolactate decarboxylase
MTVAWPISWVGAQRDVLAGDIGAHVALETLRHCAHLYAVGPVEHVRGEISIFDSTPFIARVRDGAIEIDHGWGEGACFLVWAQVPAWREVRLTVRAELADLEAAMVSAGVACGLDVSRRFPFRLRGRAEAVVFYVLDKRDGLPHTAELHERAKVRYTVEDERIEVVGFYSDRHRGIFTPKDANVHMHMKTADGRRSGHVEAIRLAAGSTVGLPDSPRS